MWALRGLVAEVGALATDLAPRPGVWGVAHPVIGRVGQPSLEGGAGVSLWGCRGALGEAPCCPREPSDGDQSLGTVLYWDLSSGPAAHLPFCRLGRGEGTRTFWAGAPDLAPGPC